MLVHVIFEQEGIVSVPQGVSDHLHLVTIYDKERELRIYSPTHAFTQHFLFVVKGDNIGAVFEMEKFKPRFRVITGVAL